MSSLTQGTAQARHRLRFSVWPGNGSGEAPQMPIPKTPSGLPGTFFGAPGITLPSGSTLM
jgi:hypothetical protein